MTGTWQMPLTWKPKRCAVTATYKKAILHMNLKSFQALSTLPCQNSNTVSSKSQKLTAICIRFTLKSNCADYLVQQDFRNEYYWRNLDISFYSFNFSKWKCIVNTQNVDSRNATLLMKQKAQQGKVKADRSEIWWSFEIALLEVPSCATRGANTAAVEKDISSAEQCVL